MKNYFDKGNEMNSGKMKMDGFVLGKSRQTAGMAKPWAGLIGVMLICGSTYANAAVCEAEMEQVLRLDKELLAVSLDPEKQLITSRTKLEAQAKKWEYHPCNLLPQAIEVYQENVAKAAATLKEAEARGGVIYQSAKRYRLADSEFAVCAMRAAYAQQCKGSGTSAASKKPAATRTEAVPPRQIADANPPSAAKGTGSSSTPGNLSPQQVTTCSEEIKSKQIESQSWTGNVNDTSARLGQFQKSLFEGRCAGHPEAQAYIAGANKMLGYGGMASGAATGPAGSGSQNRGNIEVQSAPQCAKYYVVSETQETRTTPKMFSFGIQNICNFPVYISWNGYFNDVETQSIDYAIRLKRCTSSRPVFGPGEKIEAIPFRIATQRRFHARINSVCPTEDEATRLTGKRISYIAQGAPGICIAQISDPSGVRSAQ